MLFSIPSRRVPPFELAKATAYSLKRNESFFLWFSWEEVEGKRLKSSCWVSRAWAGVVVLILVRRLRILLSFMLLLPPPTQASSGPHTYEALRAPYVDLLLFFIILLPPAPTDAHVSAGCAHESLYHH